MQLTTSLLVLAAALGAVAHPSGHAHQHFHEKRAPKFFKDGGRKLPPPKTSSVAPAASTPAPAAAAPAQSSAAVAAPNPAGLKLSTAFCPASKRATVAQDTYVGNIGSVWGCNIILVSDATAANFKYTSKYVNKGSQPHQVLCFNKIGPDRLMTGSFGNVAVEFTLAPGQSQTVAFDVNTQGSCAFAPNAVPKTSVGQWAGVWHEFDFADTANGAWSGSDCSSLVTQAANMGVPTGCNVCNGGTCSTINPGGSGTNAYTAGTEAANGLGLNLAPGNIALEVDIGIGL